MQDLKFISVKQDFFIESVPSTRILEQCFAEQKLTKPVCFTFMSDDDLLQLNKEILNHDYFTDILTFDYSDDSDFSHSEIYISVDRVSENASDYNVSFGDELMRVCLHGLLHLAGLNDKTPVEIEKMRAAEEHYLALHRST